MSFEAMAAAVKIKTGDHAAKHILMVLANYADENNECFPSVSRIAEDAEMSVRTVRRWISVLEERGLLVIEKRYRDGRQTSSKYRLTNLHSVQGDKIAEQGDRMTGGGCQDDTPVNLSLEPITKPIKDHFDEFWKIYPRRIAKKKAKQTFAAIVKRNEATPEQIIDGAKGYARLVKDTEQEFIAHPTTWLNAGRWEDEHGPPERTVWDVKMEFWGKGRWLDIWGPKPGEPGCEVPKEYLISQVKERTA